MISKEAYEQLVNGYADEVLEKSAAVSPSNAIIEKAAELLVEAVMVKEAAYDQMEDSSVCFDAGNAALDYIGYELR